MDSWTIYGKNGVAKAEVHELELHDEWMAECYLTITVKSAEPIDFAVDDYIDYRGERYAIQYDPTLLKKARANSYGEGFIYDNIKFVNEAQAKIVRCDFNDIVLNDNELHYTSLPTFPFYCESVDDLLDRILANLEDLYPGEFTIIGLNTVRNKQRGDMTHNPGYINEYRKWIDPMVTPNTEPYGKQGVAETVDNINCWDALAKVHEDFELNFIVRGYTIIVGTVGVFTANKFRYGKGNGLYEIERISDSEQQIVTRLRSYGASTNLPSRYYATLNTQVFGTITKLEGNADYASFTLDLDFSTKYFNYRSESYPGTVEYPNYIVRMRVGEHTIRGYVTKDYNTNACSIYCEGVNQQEDDRDEPNIEELHAFIQSLAVGTRVYFVSYVEKAAFDPAHTDYATTNLPDNMAVSRLMLPGFPNQSLYEWAKAHRDADTPYDDIKGICTVKGFTCAYSKDKYRPYIDSPNAENYGIRPASFFFDGSGDNNDIHPTIEGMTYNGQPIDVIYAADVITDNGVYADGKEPDPIYVLLPQLGFELDQYWTEEASIEMKDGMCGGRSLKIISKPTKIDGGIWKCKVDRVKDESLELWFPYNDFQLKSGDHYVLVGIDMPNEYVEAASERLFYESLTALQDNHAPSFTFQPRIDELWMQRQHDAHLENPAITSLHDTLKAGDIFSFADTDLDIDANIIIDVLTIRENGNNGIPTYEIMLRDEKQVTAIQKIQNKVNTLTSSNLNGSGNGGSGGGLTARQLESLIENDGNSLFLSKLTDDTASGIITFLKGIWVKAKGLFGITEDGDAKLHNADMSGNVNIAEMLNVEGQVIADWIQSAEYTGDGMQDKGYKLWYDEETGRAKLVIDDLVARGKFTVNELESRIWTYAGGNMVFSGAGSTIFFVEYLDANDNVLGYTNINAPWLLAGRPLLSAMVAWSKRRKVMRQLTDAERARVVKFRCYEYSDNGTMQTRNWWNIDDLAFCQTLNHVKNKRNSDGSYSGSLSNTVYYRLVKKIGTSQIESLDDGQFYDYVDLSNISGEYDPSYNDWPAAGDTIVQRGNRTDSNRRCMVTIEVTGDTRGLKVYDNIMGWYADTSQDEHPNGVRYTYIGYNSDDGRANLEAFGDAYIGSIDKETTYVKFDERSKKLDIKARISAQSTMPYNGGESPFQDILDGKAVIYSQWGAWVLGESNNLHLRDLLIPNADITQGDTTYKAGKVYRCTSLDPITFTEVDYTNDAAFMGYINTLLSGSGSSGDIQTAAMAQRAVIRAMQGDTVVDGGVVLTSLIALRQLNDGGDPTDPDDYTTYGGISGIYDLIRQGKSIAAWFGGDMVDREYADPVPASHAKSLLRMDGSGYFADGNITWNENGSCWFKGKITSAEGTIGGFKIGSDYLGDTDWSDGGIYISKDGCVWMASQPTNTWGALRVVGGCTIEGSGANDGRAISLWNKWGNIDINGQILNLNTAPYAENDVINIGNIRSASVNINGDAANFGSSTSVSVGSSLTVQGPFVLGGDTTFITNNRSTAKTVALPSNPSRGQVVFAKGTVGNLTLTGSIRNDEGDIVSSVGGDKRSRIFIYGDSYWNEFYCS